MPGQEGWIYLVLAGGLLCLVRGIDDLRRRRFVWGALGLLSAALILLTPIPTRAVKIDLQASPAR